MQELQNSLSGIAKLGRFGDDTLAHLSTGEMVIPPNTLDKKLQKQIQNDLAAKGVGIDRITVGSANNSINPQTGLPEFFSIKDIGKTLKGVGKGVKKFVKGATKKPGLKNLLGVDGKLGAKSLAKGLEKRTKDAAPYAVALGLTLSGIPLGPVQLGALAGGVAGATDPLLKGKKAKDILKGGAIGAALGAAGGAIGKAATASKLGAINPQLKVDYLTLLKEGNAAAANSLVSQNLGPSLAVSDASSGGGTVRLPDGSFAQDIRVVGSQNFTPSASELALTTPTALSTGIQALDTGNTFEDFQRRQGVEPTDSSVEAKDKTTAEKIQDYFEDKLGIDKFREDPVAAIFDDLLGFEDSGGLGTLLDPSKGGLDPKALALATAYGKAVEEATERTKGGIKDVRTTIRPDLMPQPVFGSGGFDLGLGPKRKVGLPRRRMATGGLAELDMRNGGDVNGPGTGTSDDIPAMLSDGEFVMTAKANNGAGGFKISKTKTGIELLKNGSPDREMGAKNMMKLMRIFEGVA